MPQDNIEIPSLLLREKRDIDKVIGYLLGWRWDGKSAWKSGISRYSMLAGVGKQDPFYWLPEYSHSLDAAQAVVEYICEEGYDTHLILRTGVAYARLCERDTDDVLCETQWYFQPAAALCFLMFRMVEVEDYTNDVEPELDCSKIEVAPKLEKILKPGSR